MSWSKANARDVERGASLDAVGAPIGDRTAVCYWKWGFYVNPNDPAPMVEKCFGLGYTFNVGHPKAWIIVVVVLGIALAAPLIIAIGAHA
jgi:uncharacterized membrane protein